MNKIPFGAAIPLIVLFCDLAFGHPGGLDASGGHHDRRSGGYHYHNGGGGGNFPFLNPVQIYPTQPLSINYIPKQRNRNKTPPVRKEARTKARTSSRTTSAANRMVESVADSSDADFLFHMTTDHPRPANDFEDNDKFWLVTKTSEEKINWFKYMVARIEPTKDPRERRTWVDASGQFSTVARFVRVENTAVILETLDGKQLGVEMRQLSEVDKKHVAKCLK